MKKFENRCSRVFIGGVEVSITRLEHSMSHLFISAFDCGEYAAAFYTYNFQKKLYSVTGCVFLVID